MTGHAWIVGAGPGDPRLITVAGRDALAGADVVLYDALVSPSLLRHCPAGAEIIYVGKRSGNHAMPQAEIEALITGRATQGKNVVRLKGGDPFVFGRGSEEAQACRRAEVPYTIVPGVTSAIAAPAYAGIPVTHRGVNSSLLILTGNEPGEEQAPIDWAAAASAGTLVILMGVATLSENMRRLAAAGKDPATPVACVRWGTRPDQELLFGTVGTIGRLAEEAKLQSPVITVVGKVVDLASEIDWFRPGPLAGKRVVVTRARAQASDLAGRLEALGAYVIEAPVIGVRRIDGALTTDERVSSRWDWIVFTSTNGVDAFFAALRAAGRDARALQTTRVAAVGEATAAALVRLGVAPDFMPSRATSDVLGEELPAVSGARILLPVSALTDDRMGDALRGRGGLVEQVAVYENVTEPLDAERVREVEEADLITFTSASTANNLRAALGAAALPASVRLVSIGPKTSEAVREAFGKLDFEAAEPSLESLLAAVLEVLAWD